MLKRSFGVAAVTAAAALLLAACSSGSSDSAATEDTAAAAASGLACVILPDSASSPRWENGDRPALKEALEAAGFTTDIQNAEGDTAKMLTIGDQMLASGCNVMIITDYQGAGAQVAAKSKAQGVPTIAYDRPIEGVDYYVSFDNVTVGTLQGEGILKCLADAGKDPKTAELIFLDGDPTDGNAAMFAEGYDTCCFKCSVISFSKHCCVSVCWVSI